MHVAAAAASSSAAAASIATRAAGSQPQFRAVRAAAMPASASAAASAPIASTSSRYCAVAQLSLPAHRRRSRRSLTVTTNAVVVNTRPLGTATTTPTGGPLPNSPPPSTSSSASSDAFMRDGGSESRYVRRQAAKPAPGDQPPLTTLLPPLELFDARSEGGKEGEKEDSSSSPTASLLVDALVVGAGPAGLALAAELAERGVSVGIVARDEPFVNTYGVWVDEFEAMGLLEEGGDKASPSPRPPASPSPSPRPPASSPPPPPASSASSSPPSVLAQSWPSAHCFFGPDSNPTVVQRGYGRVDAARLRSFLVERARRAGVKFAAGEVVSAGRQRGASPGSSSPSLPLVARLSDGRSATASLVTLACGASGARLLEYEKGAPAVAAQTAYGIEAVVEGYGDTDDDDEYDDDDDDGSESSPPSPSSPSSSPSSSSSNYDPNSMLFMDYRRHHTGVWEGTATKVRSGNHPLGGGGGLWGTGGEAPSFLYAMPGELEEEEEGSPSCSAAAPARRRRRRRRRRVFLEETCLVARPPLPFSTLKRRLERRLAAAGVEVLSVEDEEWSFIPVGGPLPRGDQPLTAFGAAGGLVHPATGYSVARSLREAPVVAAAVARAVEEERKKAGPSAAAASSPPCATSGMSPEALSSAFWGALWPADARRAAAFHVFGMELLAKLGPSDTDAFFGAFFALPARLWRGFLSSRLSSAELVLFALATFVKAPMGVRIALVKHMLLDPSGRHLVRAYLNGGSGGDGGSGGGGGGAGSGGSGDDNKFESGSAPASAVSASVAASDVAATS